MEDDLLFEVRLCRDDICWRFAQADFEGVGLRPFKKIHAHGIHKYYYGLDVGVEVERQGNLVVCRTKTGNNKGKGWLADTYAWEQVAQLEVALDSTGSFGLWAFGAEPPRNSNVKRYRYDTEGPYVEFINTELAVPE